MSDESIELPPGDDASTEIITPLGFSFGGSLHHQIYVSWGNPLYKVLCTTSNENCL